jgi:hypothetical protein
VRQVTDQFVETVQGLAVLKDLGRRGGSGTGLSVEQANEYLELVGAALYVPHSRRPGGKESSVCELEISTTDRP